MTGGRFHQLQPVMVREDEVRGYVMTSRQNCVGTEYQVMYWKDRHQHVGWFPESELEAAS